VGTLLNRLRSSIRKHEQNCALPPLTPTMPSIPAPQHQACDCSSCLAHVAYNTCLERCDEDDMASVLLTTNMRALCLAVIESCSVPIESEPPSALASKVKHWGRAALTFGICNEADDAAECFSKANQFLSCDAGLDDPQLLEARILLKGWEALILHSASTNKQAVVLERLEEAHELVRMARSANDAVTEMLFSARLYLAEHVAFTAASSGYKLLAEKDEQPPYTRRTIIRLLDVRNCPSI
jgi:hypothetical protein